MSETKTMEKWQLQELVDEAIAMDKMLDCMINEYVYEFTHRGKPVRDLTAASYQQLALDRNLTTEESIETEITVGDITGIHYKVTVAQVDPDTPKENWIRKQGVSFEPYMVNGRFDRFCYQKALTKATRNAIKQFIKANDRHKAILVLKNIGVQAEPVQYQDSNGERQPSEKETQALEEYRKHKEALDTRGITSEVFWGGVRKYYNVNGRENMTDENWADLIESLQYVEPDDNASPYAKWINDLVPF